MSEAYQCERCKQFFAGKPAAVAYVRPRDEMGETKFHREVCVDCEAAIKFLIDTPNAQNATVLALKNCGIDVECPACMSIAFTGSNAPGGAEHRCSIAMRAVYFDSDERLKR